MSFKELMGAVSVAIMVVAYAIYLWKTAKEEGVEPHPFSWFVWGLVTGVAYLVQASEHAGAGSWVVGLTAVSCFVIGEFSLFKHRRHFDGFDWIFLSLALIVFAYYVIAKDPTTSAILATTVDVIGYGPTIKKGWVRPDKDSATSFFLNGVKFFPSLAALDAYSIATVLYPLTIGIVNLCVTGMLLARRRQLAA